MKKYIYTLLGTMMLQLTLSEAKPRHTSSQAVYNHEAIQPPTDKRYALYDFYATEIYEQSVQELLSNGIAHSKVYQAYDTFMKSKTDHKNYDSQFHRVVKNILANINKGVKNLRENKTSCDHNRELVDTIDALTRRRDKQNEKLEKAFAAADMEELNKNITQIYTELHTTIHEEFVARIPGLYKQLAGVIKSFMESLDECEKKNNAELLNWCSHFLGAEENFEKYYIFQNFAPYYLGEPKTTEYRYSDNYRCKWEILNFTEFMKKMSQS